MVTQHRDHTQRRSQRAQTPRDGLGLDELTAHHVVDLIVAGQQHQVGLERVAALHQLGERAQVPMW